MIVKRSSDVPVQQVQVEGAIGATVRLLIHKAEAAPNFYMRQFTLAPGGCTPKHTHEWEHEVFVLSGSGVAATPDGDREVSASDCVYVAPNDIHQFRNTGRDELKFLCMIPTSGK